ncbi:MAG: glutamine--fructose-6-phosphate transaminase (isomerizing) [Patescibacteria group bacterium]|jgi:glucosamine--fructose-6-phosphate aminotransferase (isomerizing)|nr:glutamine--fructose-6-phosphate transaminase (isomerizing) [Patescibacteria group bacterium]
MCGIIGYLGKKQAYPIVLDILKRLEYRGYDSAGIALWQNNQLITHKESGAIEILEKSLFKKDTNSDIGFAHTRWATHGPATKDNAHPHHSQSKKINLVHNGTVLNYYHLKEELKQKNYQFYGDTDSEVLVNLIESKQKEKNINLKEAVIETTKLIEGRSAFLVHDKNNFNTFIAVNCGGDLFIGKNKEEMFVCSDKNALAGYASYVLSLSPGQIAEITKEKIMISDLTNNKDIEADWQSLDLSPEAMEKGTFPHYMLKEIFEQAEKIKTSIDYLQDENTGIKNKLLPWRHDISRLQKIIIIACGTSWHAALVSKYFFNKLANVPVYCEYASESIVENINRGDLVIAISQSGSTADTLQAIQAAKNNGAIILSICNVEGSSLEQMSDIILLTKAGPEIGVASTKAFTTQLTALFLLAGQIGQWRGRITETQKEEYFKKLKLIPNKIKEVLRLNPLIEILAKKYQAASNFLYLGRGTHFPIAMEGALKLKEVSYIHAEGLSAGEMKHGSIALIDEKMPSFFVAVKDEQYDKVVNNILEIRARNGKIIALTSGYDKVVSERVDDIIPLPDCDHLLYPFISVVPMQLFAYHVAKLRGVNIDKPRNLAKSVTVE